MASNIRYELAAQIRAISAGSVGLIQRFVNAHYLPSTDTSAC